MNHVSDTQLLDRLRDACAAELAHDALPAPSPRLEAAMRRGAIVDPVDPSDRAAEDETNVRPLVPRRAMTRAPRRMAVLVAATVALLVGSLAVAGALPAPLQRGVADLARHVGLDLPSSTSGARGDTGRPAGPPTSTPAPSTEPVGTLPPATVPVPGPLPPVPTTPVPTTPVPTAPVSTLPGPGPLPLPPVPTVPLPTLPGPTASTLLPPLPVPLPGTGDLLTNPLTLLP